MKETFPTTSGVIAYRKYVPNRVALGVIMTTKAEGDWISLPFVSILASADVISLDGRRRKVMSEIPEDIAQDGEVSALTWSQVRLGLLLRKCSGDESEAEQDIKFHMDAAYRVLEHMGFHDMMAALVGAQKLVKLAKSLCGCRGDDDFVVSIQDQIEAALLKAMGTDPYFDNPPDKAEPK